MASVEDKKAAAKPAKSKGLSPEEIYSGFQQLRNEQRALINKLSEVEMDLNEHKVVLETLKDLDGNRKCFRLIGGVLCEKTVKDVMPTLTTNRDQLTAVAEGLNELVSKKGIEINEFKEKYQIGIRGTYEPPQTSTEGEKNNESTPMRIVVNPI